METIVINVDDKTGLQLFKLLAKKMGYRARVIDLQDKEDIALLAIMKDREDEKNLSVDTTHQILDAIINK